MKVLCVIVWTYFYLGTATAGFSTNNRRTEVDLVIEGLRDQEWLEDEKQCLDQMLFILNNVRNYTVWAVWIWNSMQHPVGSFYGSKYSLGNYDQCMTAPTNYADLKINTQYCLSDVKLTDKEEMKYGTPLDFSGPTESFLNIKTKVGRKASTITWGNCLPAVCNYQSVSKIVKTMYLVNPITSVEPNITVEYCQKAGVKTEFSIKFYLFIIITVALIGTALLSTLYLEYDNSDTTLKRIAYSFSLKRNWESFIKSSDEEIPILNFIKAVLLCFTTCLHVFFYAVAGAISNGHDFDNLVTVKKHTLGNVLQHVDLPSIDNFFVVSGLLLMKGLMEKRKPIIILIQRYVRLIGSLAVLIFYTVAVSEYTGDGPLWNRFIGREQKACTKNWLISMLMLGNYVDNDNICQIVTWYIPCDYHLTVMGTLLFCIWQKDRRVGRLTTTVVAILAVLLPGIVTYWKRLPGIWFGDVENIIHMKTSDVFVETYSKSHHRAGPYLLGMAMGYVIMVYRPAKYRGIISKEWSYLGLAAAFMLGLKVLVAAPAWCLGEYNAWNSAVYAALNRSIWAIATCISIAVTEYGDVQFLRKIMAWPLFTWFSRLAYGIYITHSVILQQVIYSQRNPMQYDMIGMILTGIGVIMTSGALALLLWLFVESPLSNLANLILKPKMKTSNGIEKKSNDYYQKKISDNVTKEL